MSSGSGVRMRVWIDGKMRQAKDAKISVFDRGLLHGYGAFETMRSYAGVVFRLDMRLKRLFNSLKVLRIEPPYSKDSLEKGIYRTLGSNGLKSAYVRLTVTKGDTRPGVFIIAKEFEGYPQEMYGRGISVKFAETRQNEYSPIAGIKSLSFSNYIAAKEEARAGGFDDAILLNTGGNIAEGATSNVFMVRNNSIVTPPLSSGILPGITRAVVIEIARKLGIKAMQKEISPRELLKGSELFLTNSLAEVLPVVRVGSKRIGSGRPGEISKLLRISYQRQVIEETVF